MASLTGAFAALAIAASLQALPGQDGARQNNDATTQLEDVVVEGRRLEEMVSDFMAETSAPARGRGMARWQGNICVGVLNLRRESAQFVSDRVSQVGMELGLAPGEPGCRADIIIVFTSDAGGLTARLADEHRRAFRVGTGGLDRGNVAFADFVGTDRPIRWWHVSMPVNADTGMRAVRLPGDANPYGYPTAPMISVFAASRLNTQLRDDMRKAMVIVDIDDLGSANLGQLADYIAFVSLAQVDPKANLAPYDTILNLFDAPQGAPAGLTDWDRSYLTSLYRVLDDPQRRTNPSSVISTVAGEMTRERRAAQSSTENEH